MSDSELSDDPGTPIPSDNELEQSLRREVVKASTAGVDVTVKRIRTASEKRLGLSEDFYKSHATWKAKSKDIIEDQVTNEGDVPSSPVLKKSKPAKSTKQSKRRSEEPEDAPKNKKRKVSQGEDSSEELSSPPSEVDEDTEPESKPKKPTKKAKAPPKSKKEPVQKKSVKPSKEEEPPEIENGHDTKPADGNNSDSDLSVLIDEEPPKKSRGKSKDSQDKAKKPKPKAKGKDDEDPDKAEIKRLQGWLVKCGIRKVWGKELKPYETPKAKMKHLKDMLSDVGMTGRYSVEKATQIKDAREMAADLEAVKEGDEMWGAGDQEEASDAAPPQRKLVRGSKHFDFLSSDGEETD